MIWPVELAIGLVKLAIEVAPSLRRQPYWRWGHRYPADVFVCENCDRKDPFQQRVTSPPCPGPSKERAAELRARGKR